MSASLLPHPPSAAAPSRPAMSPAIRPAAASAFLVSNPMSRPSFERSQQRLAPGVRHPALRLSQPGREQAETEEDEDDSRGNPHDQAGELLVLQRREPPPARPRLVDGIPQTGGERQEGAQDAAVHRGGEDVEHGRPIAELAEAAVDQRPPEQGGAEEEAEVLQGVEEAVVAHRRVERRQVPDPERQAVDQEHHQRRGEEPPAGGEPGGPRNSPRLLPDVARQGPEEGGERTAEHRQRRRHQDQPLVLPHVGREEDPPQGVHRREEGGDERQPSRRETARLPPPDPLPYPPPPPEPGESRGIERAGGGKEENDERVPGPPAEHGSRFEGAGVEEGGHQSQNR